MTPLENWIEKQILDNSLFMFFPLILLFLIFILIAAIRSKIKK